MSGFQVSGCCEVLRPIGSSECAAFKKDNRSYAGTGDGVMKIRESKSDSNLNRDLVAEVVDEIIDSALTIAQNIARKYGDASDALLEKFDLQEIKDEEKDVKKLPAKGVGDCLGSASEVVIKDCKTKQPVVEKKNRLTDLVKSSKQLLSKYILSDNVRHDDPNETKQEQVVKVIELDCVQPGDKPFVASNLKLAPEVMENQASAKEAEDSALDDIQLDAKPSEMDENMKKTMTFPMAGNSGKYFGNKYKTLKITASELKKKKWKLGTKLINYIKRQGKKDGEGSKQKEESSDDDELKSATESKK